MTRIVIVGGGFAGLLAAARLGRALRDAEATLVSSSDTFVERVRYHELAAGRDVQRHSIRELLAPAGVAFRRATVTRLALADRRVEVDEGAALDYDHLVYALGSTVDLDRVPGAAEHTLSVGGVSGAEAIARRLRELPARACVLVCGAGLTGIELATEIAEAFPRLAVALVTSGVFGAAFSPSGQAHLRRAIARLGVEIHEESTVREVRAASLEIEGGRALPFDLCLWAGSFAVPSLARDAGAATTDRGQLRLDSFLRSVSHPEVFGAGDATLPDASRVPIRMGCATAMPMAAVASNNLVRTLAGRPLAPFRFGYMAQFVSLGRAEALAQYVRADDSPRSFVSTGLLAGVIKEITFRMNLSSLRTGIYPVELMMRAAGLPPLALAASPSDPELGSARE